jgi:hypothetical protein
MNPNFFTPKNAEKYHCEKCAFKCSKKSDWTRHLFTLKHKNLINPNNFTPKNATREYECVCGKKYKHMSSLCAHRKKCSGDTQYIDGIDIKDKDVLVLHLLKQNSELQHKLIELSKEKSIINTTNSHNTTNNSFNLNFFLNETCKNAMNISDFVSSIKLNLEDLEHTGRQGYIEGISNIIVKNLNDLEQWFRPIHCSDLKREVLYIKENDKWEKESSEKPILTNAIKTIANKNIKQIKNWREKYPDCTDAASKKNDMYLKIVRNSMSGGSKEECDKNLTKIISNVAKQTIIQKDN